MERRKLVRKKENPYDLSDGFKGFNQPCPKCGLAVDRRSSPYEPVGFIKYCRCKR